MFSRGRNPYVEGLRGKKGELNFSKTQSDQVVRHFTGKDKEPRIFWKEGLFYSVLFIICSIVIYYYVL